jgi:hypothetical protein
MPARIAMSRAGITVRLYPGEPWLWLQDPTGPVVRDAERRGLRMQTASRRFVGVRSGTLHATIRKQASFRRRSAVHMDLMAGGRGARYVMAHHDGTAPHEIRARRRQSLRFVVGGRVMFRRRVWHPGTRGTRFLTRALPFGAR